MNDPRPNPESASIEEATVSNMCEKATIVEVLERFGGILGMGQQIAPE